tara:strand:+ start:14 stop:442 length:429 start_codon:yes stop_codon:yes gene_type:complete
MKYLFLYLISISIGTYAQNDEPNWDYNEDKKTDTIKSSILKFINTSKVDELLSKKKRISTNTIRVFRIQLYSGNRNGSSEIKNNFKKLFPNILVETSYEQPYFKTKANAFRSKLDAEKTLKIYKKQFRDAFIFEEDIEIEKL